MHATTPPFENQLATRSAVLDVARAKLAPLFTPTEELDALPAWLWCLPTHAIARSLTLDAPFLARELALKIAAETDERHPADRYVAYLAEHHPLLSQVQRARIADFAQNLDEARGRLSGEVTTKDMVRRGFTEGECERLMPRARELIAAVQGLPAPIRAPADATPADMLRAAGELAHVRRAYAEGDLELGPAEAGRIAIPAPAAQAEGAAA